MLSLAKPPIVATVRRKLYAYGMRALNSAVSFRILRALSLERADPSFRKCPGGYSAGFASRQALHRFARQPGSELSLESVEQALSRGDQCFAISDGLSLAAYGWYAFGPTPTGLPGTQAHFDPHWVYRYKGFTLPRYRGRRLDAFAMTLALQHYIARGFYGLVMHVDSTSYDALKSCFRAGCRPFGSIYVVQGFEGRPLVFSTAGCERLGLRLEPYSLSPFGTP